MFRSRLRCLGELFSETEKLVAGLDMALQPEAGGPALGRTGRVLCWMPRTQGYAATCAGRLGLRDCQYHRCGPDFLGIFEKSSPRHLTSFKELNCYKTFFLCDLLYKLYKFYIIYKKLLDKYNYLCMIVIICLFEEPPFFSPPCCEK